MKDASQYPVTFPFGAITPPYTKIHPHLGEDRKMPAGTPILVNGQLIGLSGNSGASTGDHLHIQRVAKDAVVRPLGGGFALPKPVVVVQAGFNKEVGNYVRLQDGNGETWSYFHLYEIKVKVGDKIGDNMDESQMQVTPERLEYLTGASWHSKVEEADRKNWLGPGKNQLGNLVDSMIVDQRRKDYYNKTLLPALKALEEKREREQQGLFNCTKEERELLNLLKNLK